VTWNGVVPAGGSVTITIQAKVQANLPIGTVIANQATAAFDADGNGSNEASALSDEPSVPGAADPTTFQVGQQAIAEVPTLDLLGLAMLALLLSVGGVLRLRLRRAST
jgi:hypothetical protein